MPIYERLDHAVINVKYDMDKAVQLFKKLGFSLTPRGFHSHGSMNHLMVFESDYLELIGIPEGKKIERQDLMDAPIGINGIVFKANNIKETHSHMEAIGFDGDIPKAFFRPVEIDGKHDNARFQTATVRSDVFPAGRVYYCHHSTPDLVWRQEWQKHPNGTTSMVELVTVALDTASEAERFALLLKTDVKKDGNGARYLNLDSCRLAVLTPEQYARRYGSLASLLKGRESIFGAIVFSTNALSALNELLSNLDDITTDCYPGRTIVRISAYNTVLEFLDIEPVKSTAA